MSDTPEAGVVAGTGVVPFEFAAHNCFGCGTLNAHGLRLLLHIEPAHAWTELTLDKRFEGWSGMAHGGIVCAILDEVMAWSLVGADNWGVTARMAVDFKRPVRVGARIRAEGDITRIRRRLVETASRVVDLDDGRVLATASGTYLAADAARRRELQLEYGFRRVTTGIETPAPGDGPPDEPVADRDHPAAPVVTSTR